MPALSEFSPDQLKARLNELRAAHQEFAARKLQLGMTRGKPSAAQLDLSNTMLALPGGDDYRDEAGTDCRNYGGLDGLPAAKALFGEFLDVAPEEVIIGGNGSLTLMHDTVMRSMLFAVPGASAPWKDGPVKFLCPSPGYDRHFSICAHFDIEMVPVGIGPDGPDMDEVERLAGADAAIKGIWCVPKYANPTGCVYSDEVVDRLSAMKTAASDFRIFWDNAYAVHDLTDKPPKVKNILVACRAAGNEDRAWVFGSTSKISFAGAGLGFMAASNANLDWTRAHLSMQTIGPDKINQLRHLRFFKNMDGIRAHMRKHAAILRPKFDCVQEILERDLAGKGIAEWTRPQGGYFVSLDTQSGCASRTAELAGEVGVKLTKAGATFPYGKDPNDRNLRIAPSLPPVDEIRAAMEVLTISIEIASIEKLLQG